MTSRVTALTLPAAILFILFGCALERSEGAGEQERNKPPQTGRPEARRNPASQKLVPPGPGQHLAFDVLPRDHRRTTRYVLEITHPSGQVTLHDLKKPRLLKRRTIMVPIPSLEPGAYKLVIIAEGKGGSSRSAPIVHEVKQK